MKHQSTKCIKMYQAMVDDYYIYDAFFDQFREVFLLLPSFGVRKKVKQTRTAACTGWRWSWWNGLQRRQANRHVLNGVASGIVFRRCLQ